MERRSTGLVSSPRSTSKPRKSHVGTHASTLSNLWKKESFEKSAMHSR